MTGRSEFTEEEWDLVLEAPPLGGLLVITAQGGGSFRESFALARAYADARKQHGESELLDEIVSEKPRVDHKRYGSAGELEAQALQRLRDAVALLEGKATAAEVEDYRSFVLNLVGKVAAAHKEGAERVSPAEQAAIGKIAESLGTDMP